MLTLVIGNKNYSSWSMRPWLILRALNIPFEEVMLKFHSAEWDAKIAHYSPSKLVPVLWDGEVGGGDSICVWESNAIYEYLAERFPDRHVWPAGAKARAYARAIVAEMHAGFRPLRTAMPMNIRARFPGLGMNDDVAKNIARIEALWKEARERFGQPSASGPFLFGAFSAADAMFAPVVMRFMTYSPTLSSDTESYCAAVRAHPSVVAWQTDALAETEFVAEDEPYAGTFIKN
ncbi:MAG: glutathione S-transferase family protein [Rhodocyclaceae bacterium]|nr:glutathione S-transferase family protein [Rhodocyclaceae bacterium]MCA3024714.1 glutathione S-transferase family protein [Rhodocyclaceae bacterium]MCA3032832.1 glutathione S-transferase family protein [Rhodocyclaceae bacterium]MCA3038047.1 glutathione S-transferase family protein [Rhodocyclaceae bacterium]MCA3044952.1 glutathione S-transferase family protein [Rhodocyclaceae bacterium]